jgi:hypothetical protein
MWIKEWVGNKHEGQFKYAPEYVRVRGKLTNSDLLSYWRDLSESCL